MQEQIMPTMCDYCGKRFNTSHQHPRRYCSIACEEGRGQLPESNPQNPEYWLHLQGNPEALVGDWLVASGLKRTCYSPDWHRKPSQYNARRKLEIDEENEILLLYDDVTIGKVGGYHDGVYYVHSENMETGEMRERTFDASLTVEQIRCGNWWVDG